MNLVPKTNFGRGIMLRIIKKLVKKKLGFDIDMQIDDLSIDESADNSYVCLNANFKVSLKKSDLDRLVDRI